jgi:hypothetical protein
VPTQRLVWYRGEEIVVIPEMIPRMSSDLIGQLYQCDGEHTINLATGDATLVSSRRCVVFGNGRKKAMELRLAREIFEDERKGITGRHLLGFGLRRRGCWVDSFVLFQQYPGHNEDLGDEAKESLQ